MSHGNWAPMKVQRSQRISSWLSSERLPSHARRQLGKARSVMSMSLSIAALSFAVGCAPKECAEAKPLMAELTSALNENDTARALPVAEKLASSLENPSKPPLRMLGSASKHLAEAIKRAQEKPASGDSPERRNAVVSMLDTSVRSWKVAAESASELCK